jgi:F1F0 ATPase subunit 2
MSEPYALALAFAAGGVLGVIFFGGLWWTVLRGLTSAAPALWFFGSMMLRTGIAVTGFIFVTGSHWERALACLLGFFAARVAVTHLTAQKPTRLTEETGHAP